MNPWNDIDFLRRCVIVLFVVALSAVVGSMDYADALTAEAMREEFPITPAEPIFAHPLPCERWLAQWGPGEKPKPRCVKPAEIKEYTDE